MTGGPPVVNASLQGAKIKIIAGVINLLPYTFVVTSGIRSAELVKGKKIGISRFGSNTDYVVRLALNHFSLMPNDVQIIQVGGSQARLVALQSGAIQATVLSPEEALVAQKLGFGVLLDFIEKGIEFPHVNFVAREDYLESQAQTVKTFMKAYVETVRYYKTHRAEAVKKIMALSKLPERQMAEVVYDGSLRATPDDGKPTLKGMEVVLDAAAKENPKAEKHDRSTATGSAVHSVIPVVCAKLEAMMSVRLWFKAWVAAIFRVYGLTDTASAQQEPIEIIEDNSFLIEEAYNQEPGVVQHIFQAVYSNGPRQRGGPLRSPKNGRSTGRITSFLTQCHPFT